MQTLGVSVPDLSQKAAPASSSKQVEGVIAGLRAHMKNLGQESSPEVEAYLAKCLGSGPQAIKQASQRLEASGKQAAKLKVELAQLTANWQKFQQQVEEEYLQQKAKFADRQKQIRESLQKAEEEYTAAQESLREATAAAEKVQETPQAPQDPDLNADPAKERMSGTPKRTAETIEIEEDQTLKRLKSPIEVPDSPGMNRMDF